jgi:uncharacterized membrane protein YfcA
MDGAVLGVFLLTTFLGGLVNGLAGFALGLVVAGIWLHILTPAQTAALIVGYGFLLQCYGIWKLRRALRWRTILPFIVGGTFGVPIGTALLTYIDPDYMRIGIGVLLIAYSGYSLTRPHLKPMHAGFAVETGVGFLNGVLGGLTGLTGPIITMWCQMRGWPKDVQRAIYQPVILVAFAMAVVSLATTGHVTVEVAKLFFIGLPALAAGQWVGLKLYGHLDDATFRKAVLALLLVSGLVLVVPFSMFK